VLIVDEMNEAVSRSDYKTVNKLLKENKVKLAYGHQWKDDQIARQLYILSRVVERAQKYDESFLRKIALEIYMIGLTIHSRPQDGAE